MAQSLDTLAAFRNYWRDKVIVWSNEKGKQGKLVTNNMCPDWEMYMRAESKLQTALSTIAPLDPNETNR